MDERHDHEVAGRERGHRVADLLDHPDDLVADRTAGVDGVLAAVGPQVRAAYTRRDDAHHRLRRVGYSRLRTVLEADVARAVDRGDTHGRHPRHRVERAVRVPNVGDPTACRLCPISYLR